NLVTSPLVVAVPNTSPYKTLGELIAAAKKEPKRLNYGSAGVGTAPHLSGELFNMMAGVKLTHVPYKGATQAAADLAGGQVQVMFIAHSLALPFLPSGRVKPIAFAGGERSSAFPDLPTVAESGLPGFDYSSWVALFAPRDAPAAVVNQLRQASAKVLAQPAIKERLAKSGLELWDLPAERVTAVIREDYARWEKVVKTPGFSAE
ncbi:MAG: tripartite tricarboxylate transporter substrate-binding protein, partial [Proteobacteria bacterium]|nr:tripartite tricarboxylate transporter substrate-binding protein [Pseudomonadota bacterium]